MVRFYLDKEWIGMSLGAYFFAMGLFGFGCAGGNCSVPRAEAESSDPGHTGLLKDNLEAKSGIRTVSDSAVD
jgi:hypothetical protein